MIAPLALAAAHVGGPFVHGFGFLFFLIPLFWIVVIGLVIGLVGRRFRRARWAGYAGSYGPWGHAARGAESTLAERFAQGDIDEKEYRARLEVLRANNGPQVPMK